MSAMLRDVDRVARFGDLCYSHASAIRDGLVKGILADELADYASD